MSMAGRRKKRRWSSGGRRVPWWAVALVVVLAPIALLNLAVAFFGNSVVFPLSPFYLRNKLAALGRYSLHRPACLIDGHPPLDDIIARAESRHRVPRGLLAALVEVESNGRVHRISSAGAMGPGQLTPSTAKLLGVADPFDPTQAIDGSSRYLSAQLNTFRDVRLALAAYNAGPGAIVNRTIPQNGETEFYVRKVMEAYSKTSTTRQLAASR